MTRLRSWYIHTHKELTTFLKHKDANLNDVDLSCVDKRDVENWAAMQLAADPSWTKCVPHGFVGHNDFWQWKVF
jgi:hypothetical protein